MPIYEYHCNKCQRRLSLLVRNTSRTEVDCPHCGSKELERLFSRFAMHKTDAGVYEDILSDNRLVNGLMADDPRALAQWSKKMSGDTGNKNDPEYEEVLGKMEAGELPDLSPIAKPKRTKKKNRAKS